MNILQVIKGGVNIFKIFDPLYYASCKTFMRSGNFHNPLTAGYWLTGMVELLFILSILLFLLGCFSINLHTDNNTVRRISGAIIIILFLKFDDLLRSFHAKRHKEIMKKYSFINSQFTCWMIHLVYEIAIVAIVILSGMFWNFRVSGHI